MEAKLRSLARRANVAKEYGPEVVDSIVAVFGQQVPTKRLFDDILEDQGSADAFASRMKFSEKQRAVLLRLQAVKDIFTPNPVLDGLLTAVFLVECAMVAWSMAQMRLLAVFAGAIFITDAVTSRVKHLATLWGGSLSRWVHSVGAVDHEPLASKIQMKKWSEQSWQLAIHVGFSLAEAWLLTEEPWFYQTDSCWKPHPFSQQQMGGHRIELQLIYVSALVSSESHARNQTTGR